MRKGFLLSVATLVASAGLGLAQMHIPGTTILLPAAEAPTPPPPSLAQATMVPAGQVNPAPSESAARPPSTEFQDVIYLDREMCGPPGRFWASAEYLLWWIRDSQAPPLVTAGPGSGTGALAAPGTVILFGGSDIDNQERSGGRFTAGLWLNQGNTLGLEGSYFFLGSRTVGFGAGSNGGAGTGELARPFFDASTGMENSELVAAPGLVAGSVQVALSSRLQGAQANVLYNLFCRENGAFGGDSLGRRGIRTDLLAGFRYVELEEGLGITENLSVLPGFLFLPSGSTFALADQFGTRNQFYGGQVSARTELWRGSWFANLVNTVALGSMHQSVGINGTTAITLPGASPLNFPGGLLALPTNMGTFERNQFAAVYELGVNAGYQVTSWARACIGYTFFFLSDVVRPGDQIDRTVNPTQLPTTMGPGTLVGPARPAFSFNDTSFWAQGVNFGLEFRY